MVSNPFEALREIQIGNRIFLLTYKIKGFIFLAIIHLSQKLLRLFLAAVMLGQIVPAPAQDISFFHLNTATGLSDNLVTSAVRDKNGILWIGTAEGLNSYDGYTVKKYFKEDHPELSSNNIATLLLDDKDRIWIRDINGKITLIDEKRKFVAVPLLDNGQEVNSAFLYQSKKYGLLVFNGNKIYKQKENNPAAFEKLKWEEDTSLYRGYVQLKNENSDTLVVISRNQICVFDVGKLKVLGAVTVPELIGAAWLNDHELIATSELNRQLYRVNFITRSITHNYGNLKDQFGENIRGYLRHIRKLHDGRFIMTSGYGGVYVFDEPNKKLSRYGHDPLDVRSISANNTAHVFTDKSGYVFITTRSAGLNYFNSRHQLAGFRSSFQETSSGNIFHGFVNYVTRHKDGNFWLGTQTGLVEWSRESNKVKFHDYGEINGSPLNGIEEVRTLCFDRNDNLWVGLNRYGIVVLDKNRKVLKYFSSDKKTAPDNLPGNWINNIVLSPDNKLWVATASGLCIIDPETMRVERFMESNALKALEKTYCYSIWFRKPGETWIGTNRGACRYISSTNELTRFSTTNGLSSDVAICLAEDKKGTVYIGTSNGLNLVKGNLIVKVYKRQNGLANDRCFGLIADGDHIWIGNDNMLLCYNTTDSSFTKYDESAGLNPGGFRLLSYYRSPDGEQFWGSDMGLSYFQPGKLRELKVPFSVNINSFTAGNEEIGFSPEEKINLSYTQNNLLFGFTAVDLYSNKNIVYEYKLEGADLNWKRALSPQRVAYTRLSPGPYTFHVRATRDGINWVEASNSFSVNIRTPWWKSTAFVIFYILLVAGIIYYFIRSRSRKIRQQKEDLETEQAINYFATSLNEQSTIEDTLWDVARNCIGRLDFEDCVIYLLDEKRQVLVQKAAWGPKTTQENKILNPLEIPVGQGIVGHVAKTGKAEIINDTSKDERYIVDDVRRNSEITVPLISDGKVYGVIDSENSKKNFFTHKHLFILTTIASLCANRVVRAKAEVEKQKAEKNLLETQRQTSEMEMQALRAQMNPHFMFNSLNSINNFILKNDPDNASQYLTRFSRLMRLILDNSREEWVLLENEIKALQLYIEMEAIRFDNVFEYKIRTAADVNPSTVIVPPMIVQPYVENAIWHGLLHRKEPGSKLEIDIWKNNGELFIKVEDNGIGRKAVESLKSKFPSHKKSHGMTITAKRLEIVNKIYNVDAKVKINDLENGNGKPSGTSVLLQLKYKASHNE